jgi:hypothetical protein
MRFACGNALHRAKTDKLVRIDLNQQRRETMTNPTGFDVRGRMLR